MHRAGGLDVAEFADRFERSDRRRGLAWNALGTMYDAVGRFADATASYRRALNEVATSLGKTAPEYALVLSNLGASYVQTGQTEAGEKLVREALAIYSAADPPDQYRIAVEQNALGEILCLVHKYEDAAPYLIRALAVLEKSPGAWGEAALAKNSLGVVRFMEGNAEEGRRLVQEGLVTTQSHLGADHPMLVRFLNNLAAMENRTGHREEARQILRRSLEIAERRLGPEHPSYALLLGNYAAFLRQGGDRSGAKVLEAQSRRILKDVSRRNGLGAVIDINSLRK